MNEWARSIQTLVDEIDRCIKQQDNDALTLARLSERMGYSRFYVSRQFRAISGMQLGEYLRNRRLAFALREVRDSKSKLLDIAVKYGFSSHEAFTRAFKAAYGVTPAAYRANPVPVVLRTVLRPFDCYLLGVGGTGMVKQGEIKTYFDLDNAPFSNMVLGEVLNYPGKWSSYPPHHHPQPEVYFYRFDRPQGFGAGFADGEIYRSGHNGMAVIRHGFHSQTAAPGYAMCYAWGIRHLEGDPWDKTRIDDAEHEWLWAEDANEKIYQPQQP